MTDAKRSPAADDEREVEVLDGGAVLAHLSRAEIDVQIATAKRYPRSIKAFKAEAETLALLDEETAASMFYVMPRAGRKVEGPSVRLAEVVGSSWGNLRYGARVVDESDTFVTAQGACFDLEKNIAITMEVRRRITDRTGARYNDDMITMTGNAACSIALRNAIFKVVPFALVKPIYEKARAVSIGQALSIEQRRQRAIDWFGKLGVKADQVLKIVGRVGWEDVGDEDLITLRGVVTAIQDGDTTLQAVLTEADARPTVVTPEGLTPEKIIGGTAKGQDGVEPGSPPPAGADSAPGAAGPARPRNEPAAKPAVEKAAAARPTPKDPFAGVTSPAAEKPTRGGNGDVGAAILGDPKVWALSAIGEADTIATLDEVTTVLYGPKGAFHKLARDAQREITRAIAARRNELEGA
jgi:hypothetical protein